MSYFVSHCVLQVITVIVLLILPMSMPVIHLYTDTVVVLKAIFRINLGLAVSRLIFSLMSILNRQAKTPRSPFDTILPSLQSPSCWCGVPQSPSYSSLEPVCIILMLTYLNHLSTHFNWQADWFKVTHLCNYSHLFPIQLCFMLHLHWSNSSLSTVNLELNSF